jgi:hypothetical protein
VRTARPPGKTPRERTQKLRSKESEKIQARCRPVNGWVQSSLNRGVAGIHGSKPVPAGRGPSSCAQTPHPGPRRSPHPPGWGLSRMFAVHTE